jgi:hypothetical protein
MATREEKPLVIEKTRIIFRNFAGKAGKYNEEGDRNFCLPLELGLAEELEREGWNVKNLRSREVGDPDQPYLHVKVSYKHFPPRVNLLTSKGRTPLTEDMIEMCDWLDIAWCDIVLNPYRWSVNGNTGVKAYLKTLYIRVNEDYLELKYADVPIVGQDPQLELGNEEFIDAEVIHDYEVQELGQ